MAHLLGIGTTIPSNKISQSEAAFQASALNLSSEREAGVISVLYKRAGVKSRGSVLVEKNNGEVSIPFFSPADQESDRGPSTEERMKEFNLKVPDLAFQASERALKASQISPEKIRHLVAVSCTGFSAPGFDIELIKRLQLPSGVSRTQIGFMGCHGAINGFRAAHALAAAHSGEHILLCAAEISSIHFAYGGKSDQVVANSLFADGAGAAVFSSSGPSESWKVFSTGSNIFPDSEDAMSWKIGNHGFEMGLSPRVPQLIQENLRPWLEKWLSSQGFKLEEIGSWAVHPGGPRVLDAVETALRLDESALSISRKILEEYGNMSSATLFTILEQLYRSQVTLPCLALAFGPGLAVEAALFTR